MTAVGRLRPLPAQGPAGMARLRTHGRHFTHFSTGTHSVVVSPARTSTSPVSGGAALRGE